MTRILGNANDDNEGFVYKINFYLLPELAPLHLFSPQNILCVKFPN